MALIVRGDLRNVRHKPVRLFRLPTHNRVAVLHRDRGQRSVRICCRGTILSRVPKNGYKDVAHPVFCLQFLLVVSDAASSNTRDHFAVVKNRRIKFAC